MRGIFGYDTYDQAAGLDYHGDSYLRVHIFRTADNKHDQTVHKRRW